MTTPTTHTLSGVRGLRASPLPDGPPGARWRVGFESDWTGAWHQLYANGRLVASAGPGVRAFVHAADSAAQQLAVAACPEGLADIDAAGALGLDGDGGGWLARPAVVRALAHWRGDALEVADEAGRVLFREPLWPANQPPWGFGHDALGGGGFGYDGSLAPGLGHGACGAGPFGFDGQLLRAEVPLTVEGRCRLRVRTVRPGHPPTDETTLTVLATPPPPPAGALSLLDYDADSDRITLAIEKG